MRRSCFHFVNEKQCTQGKLVHPRQTCVKQEKFAFLYEEILDMVVSGAKSGQVVA
jgi:hypothetical protein